MKNTIITLLVLLSSLVCIAQNDAVKKKSDSLSYVSRAKADMVLSHFDSIKTAKIVFSISDQQYYVITREGGYKEYYILADRAGNIREQRLTKTSRRNKNLLEKAFDVNSYQQDFITRADNPTVDQGNPSYFVLKNADGKRYGEYSLSVITAPIPINKEVYKYLLTRLLKESTKKNKAP